VVLASIAVHRIAAPAWFRIGATSVAAALIALEAALFVILVQLTSRIANPTCVAGLDILWLVMIPQAVAILAVAGLLTTTAWTTLEYDDTRLVARRPGGSWRGDWRDVRRAWSRRGMLQLIVPGGWPRTWLVRPEAAAVVDDVARRVPAGVWLEGAALRRHLARTALVWVVVIGAAGAVVLGLTERRLRDLDAEQSSASATADRHDLRPW
jgi:hypothetical protein